MTFSKKTFIFYFVGILLFLILASVLDGAPAKSKEFVASFPTTAILGQTTVTLEIADSPEERKRGLSYRNNLPESTGLLFVFDRSDKYGFWMKEMHFPIDIIWLDENYRVVHIKENARPESYPGVFKSESPALYVLEVNAGVAAQAGLEIGDIIEFR